MKISSVALIACICLAEAFQQPTTVGSSNQHNNKNETFLKAVSIDQDAKKSDPKQALLGLIGDREYIDPVLADPDTKEPLRVATSGVFLGGQAGPRRAKFNLQSTSSTFQGTSDTFLNLLEAVKKAKLKDTRILVVSSGEIYGAVSKKDLPINENTVLKPTSPYSVSKITQDFLGLQYHLSYKLKIIRVRPFNHIGPRQSPAFVVSAFAKKIAEIEKNKREPVLSVGNLESARDFTDVRDMIKAYVLAVEKGKEGEVYNLGSGRSYKISEILDKLFSLSNVKIKIEIDKNLLRPTDIPDLVCDGAKFTKFTNWKPKIPIDVTLKDTLDYWRNII